MKITYCFIFILVLESCDSIQICTQSNEGSKKIRSFKDFTPWNTKLNDFNLKLDSINQKIIEYGVKRIIWKKKYSIIKYKIKSNLIDLDSITLFHVKDSTFINYKIISKQKGLISFIVKDNYCRKNKALQNVIIKHSGQFLILINIYNKKFYTDQHVLHQYNIRTKKYPLLFKKKCQSYW